MSFPVLVKAASGGGGKGMRIVRSEGEYDEAVAAAKREALAAFGDDTILVEKYVEHGRHIALPWASAMHLHLDVAAVLDVLLDQHGVVAERRARLALRGGDRLVVARPRRGRSACPCRRRRPRP